MQCRASADKDYARKILFDRQPQSHNFGVSSRAFRLILFLGPIMLTVNKAIVRQSCRFRTLHRYASGKSADGAIRNAQAAEVFRASYFDAIRASNRISAQDLDDLVSSHRVRPSALLGAYQIGGIILGGLGRFAPSTVSELLSKAVDSATVQQFNDSIRIYQVETQSMPEDTKETLKYHRDFETDVSATPSSAEPSTAEPSTSDLNQESSTSNFRMDAVVAGFSSALYQFLKLSRNI